MSEGQAAVVHVDVVGRFEEFENRINQLESQSSDAGERAGGAFSGKFKAGLVIAAGGALALAGAVAGIAASTVGLAQEAEQNVDEFQAKLGASREEAEKLGAAAEEVFGNNWTGSLTEAGEAVANVRREIQGLADEDIASITGATVAIAETFEQEQAGVAAAVQSVMKATGVSAQEATDFITAGFQKGLDSSGDFLDTLNEYAPQFEKTGISADQLFSLLETGAAKGALGTDKIADAYKEFSLTVSEVSDASIETYNELGLSHSKILADINSGKMTTAEAFELVTKKLNEVQGVADKTRLSAAVFGGAGEDMAAGIAGIDLTKTKLKDLQGATDSLNQRYTSFGDLTAGMWRKVQVAILPVGKELLGMANEAVPYLNRAFDQVAAKLPGLIKQGMDSAKQFGATAVNVYNSVKPAIETTVVTVQKLSSFIERNKEVLIPLTAAVGAGAAAFGIYRAGVIAVTTAKAAWAVATTTATAASVALRAALTFMTGPVGLVIAAVMLLVGAGVALYRNWDEVKAWAEKTWGRIKEIVANAINGAMNYLKGVDMKQVGLDIVQGLVNGILAGPRLVLAAARGLGSAVINGVKGILNIQSPSRVMQELGTFTGQGFVKGLESEVPSVRKAAQGTAKAFMDAFSALKLERQVGNVDLSAYTKTLEQAATQLRGKLKTVQEGSAAYTEWLKALQVVNSELGTLRGKSGEVQVAAKGAADELSRNRAQIAQGESMERYVAGLRSATTAQLAHALETAKARGEIERYNAIRDEQKRRTEVATQAEQKATDATRKAAEAAKSQRDEIVKNRAEIDKSEAWAKWEKGLRSATDAQLTKAKATAYSRGETERYNAIKTEQERRVKSVTDAHDKAADAARKEAQAVADGRKAIAEGREYDAWKTGLNSLTDAELKQAAVALEAAGNQQRYNDVLAEAKRRTDEAAQALADYEQGLRDSADALDEVLSNPAAFADGKGVLQTQQAALQIQQAAQQRQVFSDLYDTLGNLPDATIDNADAMKVLSEMLDNTTQSGGITADQLKILKDVLAGAESEADQLARSLEESQQALNEVLAMPVAERTFRPDVQGDAQRATYQSILDTLLNLDDATTSNSDAMAIYAEMIANAGKNGGVTADQLTHLKAVLESVTGAADAMAQGIQDSDDALREILANPVGEGTFRPDQRGDTQKGLYADLLKTFQDLDDETTKNTDLMSVYAEMLANAGKNGALTADQLAHLKAVLDDVAGAADAMAQGIEDSDAALKEVLANPVGEGTFRPDTVGQAQKETFERLTATLSGLDMATMQNADAMKLYSDMVENAGKSGGITADQLAKLKIQLEGIKTAADSAQALQRTLDASAMVAPDLQAAIDLHQQFADNAISAEEFRTGLEGVIVNLQTMADAGDESAKTLIQGLKTSIETTKQLEAAQSAADQNEIERRQARARAVGDFAGERAAIAALQKFRENAAQKTFETETKGVEAGAPAYRLAQLKLEKARTEAAEQGAADRQKLLEDQMNTWGNYAKQLVPLVTEAFALMSGASNETADAWAQDMGNMVNDLVSLGTAIAKGDWAAAAVQVLTTIFTWFTRNAKAANEAAKATAEYNKQFKFSDNGYQTRTVTTYTTGIFFWETTHYKEAIDSVKRDLALTAEGGFANGIKDGFSQALAANDFSVFGKTLKTTVGKAVLDGLMESFLNQEILKNIIGPAIQEYVQTGSTDKLMGAVDQATLLGEKFFNEVLKPVADKFGLLGTDAAASSTNTASTNDITNTNARSVSVNLPSVAASLNFDTFGTFSAALERAAPKIEAGGESIKSSAGEFGVHIDRLDRILSSFEYKPNLRDARGF